MIIDMTKTKFEKQVEVAAAIERHEGHHKKWGKYLSPSTCRFFRTTGFSESTNNTLDVGNSDAQWYTVSGDHSIEWYNDTGVSIDVRIDAEIDAEWLFEEL